jgi:hypothetical protein
VKKILMFLLALSFGLILVAVAAGGYALVGGIVLATLWSWFMVPVFGLPALGLVPAMGVALVWSWLSGPREPEKDSKEKTSQEKAMILFKPFIRAGTTLLIGFILKQFM